MEEKNGMSEKLAESIVNVEQNIKTYKDSKKHCEYCSKKCFEDCQYYIPNMISLEVMEEKKKELLEEYNRIHKGEIKADGTII